MGSNEPPLYVVLLGAVAGDESAGSILTGNWVTAEPSAFQAYTCSPAESTISGSRSPSISPIAGVRRTSRGGIDRWKPAAPRMDVRVELRRHRVAVVEAGQRCAVVAQNLKLARRVRLDDLEVVVAVEVVHALRRLTARRRAAAVARLAADRARPSPMQGRVAVGEQRLAVLADGFLRVGDHDADGEGGLVRVDVAGALRRGCRVRRRAAGRRAGGGSGTRSSACARRAPRGRPRGRSSRASRSARSRGCRRDRLEVGLARLDAGRPLKRQS